jgi:mRNA interferase RelE/StbE
VYKIKFTKNASICLKKLDKRYQKAVGKAIDKLSQNPKIGSPLVGKLKGLWKLRFSRYRIIYQIVERQLIVVVFEIQHRKDAYRH